MSPLDNWIAWVRYPEHGAFRRYAASAFLLWVLTSLAFGLLIGAAHLVL